MKAIYPTISYLSMVVKHPLNLDIDQLRVQISTFIRRKALGGFYYYVEVVENSTFPIDPNDPTHSKIMAQVMSRFVLMVYQTQLNHTYSEITDECGNALYFVDRSFTTEEERIKKLYNDRIPQK